jgi:hypothetical protein
LPESLQVKYNAGDVVEGYYGFAHNTKKEDRTGKKIFISYFIPVKDSKHDR